jgi:hypothetical protein
MVMRSLCCSKERCSAEESGGSGEQRERVSQQKPFRSGYRSCIPIVDALEAFVVEPVRNLTLEICEDVSNGLM